MQSISRQVKELSVVIADDDDITREMLRGVLRAAGLHVVGEASDGARAIEIYGKLKPAIVCLDIDMPVMNGMEALKKIRESDAHTIVLMITALATGDNVRGAIAEHANGIIAKPFNTAKILVEIERALTARRASRTPPPTIAKASTP
jgi:two-component system chemotaxis response regulator CheY